MQFSIKPLPIENTKTECLLIPIVDQKRVDGTTLGATADEAIRAALKSGDLPDKPGAELLLRTGGSIQRILLVSMGSGKSLSADRFVKASKAAYQRLANLGANEGLSLLHLTELEQHDSSWRLEQEVLAARLAAYQFDQLKSEKPSRKPRPAKVGFACGKEQTRAARKSLTWAQALANGSDLTRDLGNLPANICTPTYLANCAKKMASEFKLKVQVLEERQMRQLKMGSLLSVSQGSDQPAKLIVLQYNGAAASKKPVVLVGKGITFDTGGISMKPAAGMDEMKYDMGGAAAALGTIRAVAEMKLKINLIVVVPTSENMPSGRATRPGDIVTSMSGQTIEILNTDAEGRLVLCDALTYCERFKPKTVIDIATLTGACVVALGHHHTGMFARSDALADELLAAGRQSLDSCWRLPLDEAYHNQIKSPFADVANVGGRDAGAVTAACFLERFTRNYDWAHLDIAGTAWHSGANKSSSGRPVAMLVRFLSTRSEG